MNDPQIQDMYRLTPVQEGILFHTLYAPNSGTYCEQFGRYVSALDPSAFEEAWQRTARLHPVLRTAFFWEGLDKPAQVIHREARIPFDHQDWRGLAPDEQEQRIEDYVRADRLRGLDLARAPLTRVSLLRLADDQYYFNWTYHHLLLDGWSAYMVLDQVSAHYAALCAGAAPPALAAPRAYRDYVAWLGAQDLRAAEAYWRRTLRDLDVPTPLPIDRAPGQPQDDDDPYERYDTRVSRATYEAMQAFARSQRLTLNTIIQGALALLLARYARTSDVIFGSTVAGRPPDLSGVESMVGLFINTLPVRLPVPSSARVLEWLRDVQARLVELRRYEYSPLVEVQNWSDMPRGTPLFNVLLTVETYPVSPHAEQAGWRMRDTRAFQRTNYPLTLWVEPGAELSVRVAADPRRIPEDMQRRVLGHYEALLAGLVAAPDARLADVPLLPPSERRQVVAEWNAAGPAADADACLHEIFARRAAERPDACAVTCDAQRLSYATLDARASRLARRLRGLGVAPNVRVGLYLERGVDLVVAVLAVLKAGGAYVPVDPAYPSERLAFMLADAQAPVVITHGTLAAGLPPTDAHVLRLDALADEPASTEDDPQPAGDPPGGARLDDVAYVIYTSGSTGQPKGVMVTHRNVVRLFRATEPWFGFDARDVWTLFHSYAFDFSVWELWGALLYGGRLVVVPYWLSRNPEAFHELLRRERVSVLNQTPSAFRQLVAADEACADPEALALRYVIFGGEALEFQALRPWFELHGDRRPQLVNMYGITETTVHVTYHPVRARDLKDRHAASIVGRPIPDLQIYIVDPDLAPLPIGVPGELLVGGAGLAAGYLNRPDLTAERFVPDPFSGRPGARVYRSGDLARYLSDGRVDFLGRIDQQVKVRGFRIELGEIEAALAAQPGVQDAAVIAQGGGAETRLVAYLVPRPGAQVAVAELRAGLKLRLPEYMLPAAFVLLEHLPLTTNGKLDRKALPDPEQARRESDDYVAPGEPIERAFAELWVQVLRLERVGLHDNFFELGGDSILTIQFVSRAKQAGFALQPRDVFQHPTLAELARLAAERQDETGPAPPRLTPEQVRRARLDPAGAAEGRIVELAAGVDGAQLEAALQAVCARHDALRLRCLDARTGTARLADEPDAARVPYRRVESSTLSAAGLEAAVDQAWAEARTGLDSARGPLLRALELAQAGTVTRLVLAGHPLAFDDAAWRLLLDELDVAYRQVSRGLPLELPAAAAWPRGVENGQADAPPESDAAAVPDTRVAASVLTFTLEADATQQLVREVPAAYGTRNEDLVIAALARSAEPAAALELEVSLDARASAPEAWRTLGHLGRCVTLRFPRDTQQSPRESLRAVKQALRMALEQAAAGPRADTSFADLGDVPVLPTLGPVRARRAAPEVRLGASRIAVQSRIEDGCLHVDWIWRDEDGTGAGLPAWATRFGRELRRLSAHCLSPEAGGYVPADFPLAGLDQAALDRLLGHERSVEDLYPLSPVQQGMLFHAVSGEAQGVYLNQFTCTLPGDLEPALFQAAWARVLDHHPALRVAFLWEGLAEPLQRVVRGAHPQWTLADWRGLPAGEQRGREAELLAQDRARGLDLACAPPMRMALVRLRENAWRFVWTHHHILLDGWSLPLVLRDVFTAYDALAREREPALPLARPYRDFVSWLRRQDIAAAESFWRRELLGFDTPTAVTPDRAPDTDDGRQGRVDLLLSEALTAGLAEFARARRVTLGTLLQGAWALLLSRYSGTSDVVFGTIVSGRPAELPGVETIVGNMLNTLPVRVDAPPDEPVDEWLRRLHARLSESRQHEHASLLQIQSWSEVPRGVSLFDSIVVLENAPIDDALRANMGGSEVAIHERPNYPLSLVGVPGPRLKLDLLHAARFSPAWAQRALGHVARLLEAFVGQPQERLGCLPLLTAPERRQVLAEWNDTALDYAPAGIAELFEEQARANPAAPAVVFGDACLSYGELEQRANRLAAHLRARGITRETPVGLCLERSFELVVALLATLKAGGLYVPLDPAYPEERLGFMIHDSGCRVVLTHAATATRLPDAGAQRIDLDAEAEAIAARPAAPLAPSSGARQLAYIVYTSGSTGTPKGVAVEQRSVVRLVRGTRYAAFGADDVFLQLAPVAFDASTFEIWGALLNGARLALCAPGLQSLEQIGESVRRHGVTKLFLTTGLFHQMVELNLDALRGVGHLLTGGELISGAHVRQALQTLEGRLSHVYGPTEVTTFTTGQVLSTEDLADGGVPIGRPIDATQVYVLDANMQPLPVGVPGELYAGGDGLARGYWGRPALTAERFVPDPYGSQPGARLYRSGDVVRWRPEGTLEFLGRRDHQVKVRGFRIELGEIEAALLGHPQVQEAVVLCRQDSPGDKRLVAYVAPHGNATLDAAELRQFLKPRLPEYMLPASYVRLERLPLTANGKIDRRALPAPDLGGRQEGRAPRNDTERTLAGILSTVLCLEQVGVEDDFFELGGDSIRAIQFVSRAKQAGLRITPRELFEHPTLAELAELAAGRAAEPPGAEEAEAAVSERAALAGLGPESLARLHAAHPALVAIYPLAPAQQGMLFHSLYAPRGQGMYVNQFVCTFPAPLEIAPFADAWRQTVARHPQLGACFAWERLEAPVQVVAERPELEFVEHDWRALAADERREREAAFLAVDRARGFDLACAPLMRLALLRVTDDAYRFVWTHHHIVLDGWSLPIVLKDVLDLYAEATGARAIELPPAPAYAGYAEWLLRQDARHDESFWRQQLAGFTAPTPLPFDRPAAAGEYGRREARLSRAATGALEAFARRQRLTPSTLVQAAWALLLARYSGEPEVLFGLTVAGRPGDLAGVEALVGNFLNTVPVRVPVRRDARLAEWLAEFHARHAQMRQHEHAPLVQIQTWAGVPRGTPLFDSIVVFENTPIDDLLRELSGDSAVQILERTNYPLTLLAMPGAELSLRLLFEDRFDGASVERMLGHLCHLLEQMAGGRDCHLGELDPLTPAERHHVLVERNDTRVEYAGAALLHELIEAQADRTPEAVAVRAEAGELTYAQLDRQANRLAHHLRELGVGPETLVGICMERSLEMVVGLLAILKAGGAYVPLDPAYPLERLRFMLEDAQAPVLLTQAALAARIPAGAGRCLALDDLSSELLTRPEIRLGTPLLPSNAAYMIYTSGSTGQPKGAINTHGGIRNRLLWMQARYGLGPADRVLQKTPSSFDVSVWEFFWPLLSGARLVLARPGGQQDPGYLVELIAREQITTLHFVPPMLELFLRERGLERCGCLRRVMCSGEALSWELKERFRALLPAELHNLYGPTEAAVDVSAWDCREERSARVVPIGRPIANLRLYVLDPGLDPLPVGVPGELYIGGAGVGRGYHRRPDLCAEKFVPDPFAPEPGARLYRTGDASRLLADGNIEYLGRLDHQVKLRGFRIELPEIEAALLDQGVREAVVLCREDAPGDPRLVAYVVPAAEQSLDVAACRTALKARLPDYMVPSAFVTLERLPLSPNGKLDRKALPPPGRERQTATEYVAPGSPDEERIARIWQQVLGVERVGVHDNFFDLGGHSLLMIRASGLLDEAFGRAIPLVKLFEYPSVATLAEYLARGDDEQGFTARSNERIDRLRQGRGRLRERFEKAGRHAAAPVGGPGPLAGDDSVRA